MKKHILLVLTVLSFTLIFSTNYIDLIKYRIEYYNMNVSEQDIKRIEQVMPYIIYTCEYFDFDPLYAITLFEIESNYKWVYGDSGDAVGFGQIHLATAWNVIHNYKDYLEELGLNTKVTSTKDLYSTPIRTSVLSILYLIDKYERNNYDIYGATMDYNGTDKHFYSFNFMMRYSDIAKTFYMLQ